MASGLDRVAQQRDFSGGMWRSVREDLIPPNGVYDVTNGLLDNGGAVYRRGGSSYRSTAAFGSAITFIWDGWIGTPEAQTTLIASPTAWGRLNADGTVTNLGGSGLSTPGRATALNGVLYLPGGVTWDGTTLGIAAKIGPYYTVAANRLLVAVGGHVHFSDIGVPGTFASTDYHWIPDGTQVIGLRGLRDAAAVFTTTGVWIISNMGFDLTDASGNVQHRLDHFSSDLILWGDAGLAAWEGGLVVPAVDGVWQLSLGVASEAPQSFRRLSTPIDSLYRDYVHRGYQPGQACVFRGHYLLPILDGLEPVDLLVCRLDAEGTPWTHFSGAGSQLAAVTVRLGPSPRQPELIGGSVASGRVLTLSYFDPDATTAYEADGTAHWFSVQPRDYPTGPLNENTIVRLRMGYDLGDPASANPTISATQISGRSVTGATEWGLFDWGQKDWSPAVASTALSGTAPEDEYGYKPYVWHLAKRERFARFRVWTTSPASHLTLRWLEVYARSNGRI